MDSVGLGEDLGGLVPEVSSRMLLRLRHPGALSLLHGMASEGASPVFLVEPPALVFILVSS